MGTVLTTDDQIIYEDIMTQDIIDKLGQQSCFPHYSRPKTRLLRATDCQIVPTAPQAITLIWLTNKTVLVDQWPIVETKHTMLKQ